MKSGIRRTVIALGLSAAAASGQAVPATVPPATGTTMAVLQPAVMSLQQAIDALRVDKWKASKDLKAATTDNIVSIRRDVEGTLPGLVTAADAAPGSVTAMLPLSRNVGALYDVVLRVTVIAESSAPGDQTEALEKSLSGLEVARRTLADRQQAMAVAEEAKVGDLQRQLSTRPAVAAACPPVIMPTQPRTTSATAVKRKKKAVPKKAPSAAAKPSDAGQS